MLLSLFGGAGGLASFGLKALPLLGSIFGGGVSAEEKARHAAAVAQRNALLMKQKTQRAFAKQSLAAARDANLDSAANAYQAGMNEFWDDWAGFKIKQASYYSKSRAVKGKAGSRGIIGKSAERAEKLEAANHLMEGKYLALAMQRKSFRVNKDNEDVWNAYRNANQEAFDKSSLGIPISITSPIAKPQRDNSSFFDLLKLTGDTLLPNITKNPFK